jgi:hypothetical protein
MHHESSIRADTRASPVAPPPPSSATTLSTQLWQHAAQQTETALIGNSLDSGEAPQSRKRLLTSTAPPVLVSCGSVPLDSRSDTLAPNEEEDVSGTSSQLEPPKESKRRRPQAVEEAETDAIPMASPTLQDLTAVADAMASPMSQVGVSWPRPRLQVGWECEGKCRGAYAPARQTLRVYLLPEAVQAHMDTLWAAVLRRAH